MTLLEILKNIKNIPTLSIFKTDKVKLEAVLSNVRLVLSFLNKGYSLDDNNTDITNVLLIYKSTGKVPSKSEYNISIKIKEYIKLCNNSLKTTPLNCIIYSYNEEFSVLELFTDLYLNDKNKRANLLLPTNQIKDEVLDYVKKNRKEHLNTKKIENIRVNESIRNAKQLAKDDFRNFPVNMKSGIPKPNKNSYVFAINMRESTNFRVVLLFNSWQSYKATGIGDLILSENYTYKNKPPQTLTFTKPMDFIHIDTGS